MRNHTMPRLKVRAPLSVMVFVMLPVPLIAQLIQKNVYYLETDRNVRLEGFAQSFLPAAEKTHADGVIIVKQHLPEDPDSYMIAVVQRKHILHPCKWKNDS